MKVGIVTAGNAEASSFYRVAGPLSELKNDIEIIRVNNPPAKRSYDWSVRNVDVLFMQRLWTQESLDLIEVAEICGVPTIVDYDDNMIEIPIHNPVYHAMSDSNIVKEIIQRANLVTVSTPAMKEAWEGLNPKRIEVVPNAYNHRLFPYAEDINSNFGKIVVWRGTATHARDLHTVADAMTQIIDEHPNWVFVFINHFPHFLEKRPNVTFLPWMPLTEYMHKTWMIKPAITWVPLEDNLFNRCKSNCAWIEATHAQAVTIAPDFEEWERPGIFNYDASNANESFYNVAKSLIDEIDKDSGGSYQKSRAMQARSHIYENLLVDHTNEDRSRFFKELACF